jgi:5-methylcytosine-specific restriction endonuclease McrA
MIRSEMKKYYDKEWCKISRSLIKVVGHCVACGIPDKSGRVLTVHHMDFDPTNNLSSNLLVLCARCHLRKHGLIRKYGRDTDCQMEIFVKMKVR